MTKVKWGAIVTDGRGKAGGSIFSKNRAGAYFKNFAIPSNPNTSYQAAVRSLLGTISANWKLLTEAERSAWNSAVDSWRTTDVFGDSNNPSGFDLYCKLNFNLVQVGVAARTTPPLPGSLPVLTGVSLNGGAGLTSLPVSFNASSLTSNYSIVLFMTAALSAGVNYVKNKLRALVVLPYNESPPYEAYTAWAARFGTLSSGVRVSMALQVVNRSTGQKSVLYPSTAIITHVPVYNVVVYYTNASNGGLFPSGWSTDEPLDWINDNTSAIIPNSSGYTGASGSYKFVNADLGYGTDYLYSPVFDLTGASNVRVSFGAIVTGFDAPDRLQYSVNGGSSWVDVVDYSANSAWTLYTNTIVALANVPSVQFRFEQSGSDGLGTNALGIDDFKIIADYL